TRFSRDWSSDVCSSDLNPVFHQLPLRKRAKVIANHNVFDPLSCSANNFVLTHRKFHLFLADHSKVRADGWVGLSKNVRSEGWRKIGRASCGKECGSEWS